MKGKYKLKDEKLKAILDRISLDECEEIIDNHVYYCKKNIKQRCYRGDGSFSYYNDEYEFLVIADGDEKQAIILRCGYVDLHWYVLKKWRGDHVLSDALRTGVIKELWPENNKITCCYSYEDDCEQKYQMTKHLADLAGLELE